MASHNFGHSIDHCLFFSQALASHNSFSFFFFLFSTISATPLLQFLLFFFSLSLLYNTSPISSAPLIWAACILGKNFDNYIIKIQLSLSPSTTSFLTPLSYLFLKFQLHYKWNFLFFSFSQISLNSTHITNKFHFLQC